MNDKNYDIACDTPQGPITETYVVEGDMLRLDRAKAPLKKGGYPQAKATSAQPRP